MVYSHGPLDETDPSLSEENLRLFNAVKRAHPRPKGSIFRSLDKELGDPILAEMIWLYYGVLSFEVINIGDACFNPKRRCWWKFWKRKNTIKSLIKTKEGKKMVWQTLHDADIH